MACVVKSCHETTSKKNLMCSKHWYTLPLSLRDDVRRGTEKGTHTLRAHPSREWLSAVTKYVGDVKNLIVHVGADNKIRRNFQKPDEQQQQQQPPASV